MSFLGFLFFIALPQAIILRVISFITKLELKKTGIGSYYLPGLIIWTVIGFFFLLDNNSAFGCTVNNSPVFSTHNIRYSLISLILLLIAYFIRSEKLQIAFLLCEFAYWLIKLMTIKGGYAVGIGGGPDFTVVYFDTIALFLRLLVLYKLLNYKISLYYIFIPLFVIMFYRLL
jgi:hypothetical protein